MSIYHMCAFYPRKPEKGAGFLGVTEPKLLTTEPSLELPDTLLKGRAVAKSLQVLIFCISLGTPFMLTSALFSRTFQPSRGIHASGPLDMLVPNFPSKIAAKFNWS